MKPLFAGLSLLLAIAIWQAVTITRLPIPKTDAPPATASTVVQPRKTPRDQTTALPGLPENLSSAESHRDYFRKVMALDSSTGKAASLEDWAAALTTNDALQAALDALSSAPEEERLALMGRFGPALLSQWGRIAPKQGLLSWAALDTDDQWRLANTDPALVDREFRKVASLPQPLLDSWAATAPDDFFAELTDPKSIFLGDDLRGNDRKDSVNALFATLAGQQPVGSLIGYLNDYSSRKDKSSAIHSEVIAPMVANKLITENGGLDGALEAARSLPETPARESLVMDLEASRLMRGVNTLALDAENAKLNPALTRDVLASFEQASQAGKVQFLTTLRAEESRNYAGDNQFHELKPAYVAFREQLEASYQNQPGLSASQQALIPNWSRRSSEKTWSTIQLNKSKKEE